MSLNELQQQLNDPNRPVVDYNECVIGPDETLTIPANKTLVIKNGHQLVNDRGKIINNGTINTKNDGTIYNVGEFKNNNKIVNYGTIYTDNNGVILNINTIVNYGLINTEHGVRPINNSGEIQNNGTTVGMPPTGTGTITSTPWLSVPTPTFSLLKNLLDNASPNSTVDFNGCKIRSDETLTIPVDITLNISNVHTLINEGTINNSGTINNNGTTTGQIPTGTGTFNGIPWGLTLLLGLKKELNEATPGSTVDFNGCKILSGETLTIPADITLKFHGYGDVLTNHGTIDNRGTINASNGDIVNNNTIENGDSGILILGEGTIINNGTIENKGNIESYGNFTNSGTINNIKSILCGYGSLDTKTGSIITNKGEINLRCYVSNRGEINNNVDGKITIVFDGSPFLNHGTINNKGTINNDYMFLNWGGILNNNEGGTFKNTGQEGDINAGIIKNGRYYSGVPSSNDEFGVINNRGTINTEGGKITNTIYGIIYNDGEINSSTSILNNGTINNNDGTINVNAGGTIANNNTIENNGIIEINDDGAIINKGTTSGNEPTGNENITMVSWGGKPSLSALQQELNNPKTNPVVDFNGCEIKSHETLTIPADKTLNIKNGEKLINAGIIKNKGSVITGGVITNNFQIINDGTIESNYESVISNNNTFTNNGLYTYKSGGTFYNDGTFNNKDGGIIENNSGQFYNNNTTNNDGKIVNQATIYNSGTINNNGEIEIDEGAIYNSGTTTGNVPTGSEKVLGTSWGEKPTYSALQQKLSDANPDDWIDFNGCEIKSDEILTIPNGITLYILTGQTLINHGKINNDGKINNEGTINNNGEITTNKISGQPGSHLDNDLNITGGNIYNTEGIINNNGLITINNSKFGNTSTINNEGTINNNGEIDNGTRGWGTAFISTINNDGTIVNDDIINNHEVFNNHGTIDNKGTIENSNGGTFNNNGTIEHNGDNTIINNYGTVTGNKPTGSGTINGNPWPILVNFEGKLKYLQLEGGFFGLTMRDGTNYLPLPQSDIPKHLTRSGLYLKGVLELIKPVPATTYQWGIPVKIIKLKGTLSFSGKVEKGSELSADTRYLSDGDGDDDGQLTYKWQISYDGTTFVDIYGATSPSYKIPDDPTMVEQFIRIEVVSTDTSGESTTFESEPRKVAPSSASSVGDPYVFPLNSDIPVKLPNKNAFYRMFEYGNTFINASVSQATTEHMNRIVKYALAHKNSSVDNLIVDGYFYDKFFISVDGNELIVDLQTKQLSFGNIKKGFFKLKKCYLNTYKNNYFTESHKTLTIGWMTQNNKEISIDVMFFDNPQVENGIRFRTNSNVNNSIGMLIDNYKPKLMTIPMLQTTKYNKIHKRLSKTNNIHYFKNIIPKNETWK